MLSASLGALSKDWPRVTVTHAYACTKCPTCSTAPCRPEDLPPKLQSDFNAILAELDKRRKAGGGFRWRNRAAARIARRIYDLWYDFDEETGRSGA
jgi:hypothetical protein